MRELHVGDEVEVPPDIDEGWEWKKVSGLRGTVRVIKSSRLSWGVGVQFEDFTGGHNLDGLLSDDATREGWWCDSAWLRHVQPPGGSPFTAGDLVDMGTLSGGKVIGVDAEPRYSVQWPDGRIQRIKESTLRRHAVAPPIVCALDGTRCEWMAQDIGQPVNVSDWQYCPMCGGKLRTT